MKQRRERGRWDLGFRFEKKEDGDKDQIELFIILKGLICSIIC